MFPENGPYGILPDNWRREVKRPRLMYSGRKKCALGLVDFRVLSFNWHKWHIISLFTNESLLRSCLCLPTTFLPLVGVNREDRLMD
jgi:hypothetical protein